MSWKPEGSLAMRWTLVRDYRTTECDDPVTHRITDGHLAEV